MPTNKVQPISIVLNVKGAEKFSALNRSFRDLSKQARLSDKDIVQATEDVIAFAKAAGNSEATIRGQIKAFEGLREQASAGGKVYLELSSQIKQLKSDLRGSTDASEEQRVALVKAGQAAKGSAADIKSVVSELERLQKSARPGSSAFAQLSKDIAVLKSQLKEANVEVKKFNAGFEISQRPAMSLEKIQRQIGRLTEGLKGLNFVSNDFLAVQQRISLLGQVQSATIGRQQVIAREQMFSSAAFETFAAGPAGSLQLPKTAAALNLEIGELQERLANTVPGETYANLTVEIASKQRELQAILTGTADAYDKVAAAQDRSTRVAQKLADLQEYQRSSGFVAPGAGGYRDPETGAMIASGRGQIADRAAYRKRGEAFAEGVVSASEKLGAIPALPMAGTTTAPGTGADISGMARRFTGQVEVTRAPAIATSIYPGLRDRAERLPSAQVGVQPAGGFGEQVIRRQISALREAAGAYRPYNDAIRKARAANNGSINSINNLKNALIAKRNEIPATSAAFRRLSKEIQDLDDKSERASRRMSRRRMSPMQMTQAAGAVLSGGIFGGPEGFVGGAAGALVGGVGGAFAGAAIGAQVGGIRRTLGEYADYAAQITRLQIALEGISGSQAQYNRALQAAADVTAQLNVPQEVAVQGMTRLVAAVKGAGGGVAEAEVAFKNINAAIIATGGGAEQVQGAVTALVQIFSKGKVSAEEINQIAERLPGTFNKIAAASGRTGPELTKALQQGTVGLNDLMKFLVSLGDEYGELAAKIAGSSENAGARLQVAFNQMRIEVGNALQPIGAEFQDVFREFIVEITPTLVKVLPKIGEFVLAFAKNLDVLAAAAAGAVTAMGLLALTSGALGAAMLKTAAAAGTLSVALKGVALLNPFVLLGAGLAAATVGIVKYYNNQKELNELLDEGKGSTETLKEKIQEYEDSIAKATKKLEGINGEKKATGREANNLKKKVAELRGELQRLQGTYKIRLEYESKGYKFGDKGEMTEFTVGNIVYGGPKGARAKALRYADGTPIGQNLKGFDNAALGKDGSGSGKKRESRVPQLAQELIYLTSAAQIKEKIRAAELDGNKMLQIRLEGEMRLMELAKQSALIDLEKIPADEKQLKQAKLLQEVEQARLDIVQNLALEGKRALEQIDAPLRDLVREYEKEAKTRERINELIKQGVDEGLAQEFVKIEEIIKVQRELLDERIKNTEAALLTKKIEGEVREELEKQLEILKKQREELPEREGEAKGAATKTQEPEKDFFGKLDDAIKDQRDALEELVKPINQIVSAANAIGDAFKSSFKSVIDGSSSAKQALSDFFKSVGDYFLDMAAEIAAEALKLAALEFVKFIVSSFATPQIGSGTGAPVPGKVAPNGKPYFGPAYAEGGYVPGGFKAFSEGGVVSRPTLGLVGEGSEPEYIIPQSKMSAAMSRYSRGSRGGSVIPGNGEAVDGATMSGTVVGEPIDVRYTVERINDVDYVTADQFRLGMQRAAQQGAAEGERRTLRSLKNSPGTRRGVGM